MSTTSRCTTLLTNRNGTIGALVDQVAKDANTLFGGNEESMLWLDETSF